MNEQSKRKIAILGCLSSFISSYSVAGIVEDQLHLLSDMGEDVVFITTDDFQDQNMVPKGVEIRYYPRFQGSILPHEIDLIEFEKYVFLTSSFLRNCLEDCTHVIQHDLLFIHSYVPVNWAIRECAKLLPHLKWFHWQHSAPSPMPSDCEYPMTGCYLPMENSKFIYLNRTDIPKVAERYSIPENKIALVHNFIDFKRRWNLHSITCELIDAYDLYSADTICIFPTRLTSGKQIHKAIKLLERMKALGQKVRMIIANSWSNGPEEKEFLKNLLEDTTLTEMELIFTSEFDSKWAKENSYSIELGIPRESVLDLLRLSDLFILSSSSECCSMTMLEAAAAKNTMILNSDLFSLYEFGGQKMNGNCSTKALYLEFGSNSRPIENYLPNEETWYTSKAEEIISYQNQTSPIQFFKFVRQRHNPQWVYFNQLLPLFEG